MCYSLQTSGKGMNVVGQKMGEWWAVEEVGMIEKSSEQIDSWSFSHFERICHFTTQSQPKCSPEVLLRETSWNQQLNRHFERGRILMQCSVCEWWFYLWVRPKHGSKLHTWEVQPGYITTSESPPHQYLSSLILWLDHWFPRSRSGKEFVDYSFLKSWQRDSVTAENVCVQTSCMIYDIWYIIHHTSYTSKITNIINIKIKQ